MEIFCDNYQAIIALNESGNSNEDILQKALEFFKSKHRKIVFVFLHFLLVDRQRCASVVKNEKGK